jgi:hypothetical protein
VSQRTRQGYEDRHDTGLLVWIMQRAFVQRHMLLHPVLTQGAGIRIGLLTAVLWAGARRHLLLFPPFLG